MADAGSSVPSRRAPRWVYWPGKLLWAPSLLFGVVLTAGAWPGIQERREGTWSVIISVGTPDRWVTDLAFIPGVLLLLIGIASWILYTRHPGPGRAFTSLEFPIFTIAAWIFGVLGFLSLFRFDGHVAGIGFEGFDWRFLVHARTTTLDRIVAGVSLGAAATCWTLSWGFVRGRTAADAYQDQQHAHGA